MATRVVPTPLDADYFRKEKMSFKPVLIEKLDELLQAYAAGRCDAYTTDASGLAAVRAGQLAGKGEHVILPERISKEPLGPIVRHGDDQWFDVVKWTLMGMIEAAIILGACLGQGYGLAKPMSSEAFPGWHKSFALPVESGVIHTSLGALAHTWLRNQSAMADEGLPNEHHPLTLFFAEQGLDDSQAAQWHARILAGGDTPDASQKLLAWLVERVIREGTQAS